VILKLGDSGPDVEQLQLKLKAAGYDPGDVDGDYGARTAAAVLAFQADRPDLEDDGVAGPMTLGALDAAITKKPKPTPPPPSAPTTAPVPCEDETWTALQKLVGSVTGHPVRYGPGRGLWSGGKLVVTCGPGSLGLTSWPNAIGRPYASFHCTSWCNFFLGWLLRRNEEYTHAGNIPSIFDLLEKDGSLHQNPGAGPYRGYGDACSPIAADGSGAKRSGCPDPKAVDAREVYARRASLPTFVVWGQSTKRRDGTWNWWHHTGLFIVDHRDHDRLYRIAADGYKGPQGYSADPMRWIEITDQNVGDYDAAVYRPYGVSTVDGTYGDKSRPIADVDFEM
jgi:peptidoglycan hydrolase-like protein with peptidoglycan-binding domain